MASITSQNAAQAIVKLVAANGLAPLVGNLVMGNLVNRDYEPSLASAGDTINVPIPATMTANNLAEAGSVQTQNPSLGNAQIVLNTHVESTFQIPDVTKILASPDLLKMYMQPAIIAITEKIETDLLSLYNLFTYNAVLGGASTITEALVDTAESNLFAAKMPKGQNKALVVSTTTFSALRQIQRFTEWGALGEASQSAFGTSSMVSGKLPGGTQLGADGRIKDFWVFRSQYVPKPSNAQNFAFGTDALALVMRRLPQPIPGTGAIAEYAEMGNFGMRVVMSYAPNTLAQQFTVDALYGVGVLRQNFGQVIQTSA